MVQADKGRGFRHAVALHDRVTHTLEKLFGFAGESRAARNKRPEFPSKSPVYTPEAPCPPQKLLTVCQLEISLEPVTLALSFEFAFEPSLQGIEHSRHRNERRGPLALHCANNLARIRGVLKDYCRTQERRHKERQELPEYVAQWHQRDETQRMKPSLIVPVGINPALERLEICQKIPVRPNYAARLSRGARSEKDLRNVISRDGLVGKAFIRPIRRPARRRGRPNTRTSYRVG